MTTSTYAAPGRPRHSYDYDSAAEESVPRRRPNPIAPPVPPEPPIYRALLRTWADRGRTLPGRYDPEWVRLAAPPIGLGIVVDPFSGSPDPRGDGR
ncbi:hypothetical protein [Streptomyces geranii]|uniref:hypothetical protein n=1 Tax=Streptomyces geranii TaxID=2058923 RepID=UPI001E654CCD|nr:hypothetical protein [Streptomyces geranii]